MPLRRTEDFSENDIRGKWLGKSYNFHRLWDINLIDSCVMYYGKLTYDLEQLSFRARNQIFVEPIKVWIAETQVLAMIIYKNTPP
jgi:hypothetical protein